MRAAPRDPRKRPKPPALRKPKKGKRTISKYINFDFLGRLKLLKGRMDWTSQNPKLPYDSELNLNQSSAPPNLHDDTRPGSPRDPGLFLEVRKESMCGGRDPQGINGLT